MHILDITHHIKANLTSRERPTTTLTHLPFDCIFEALVVHTDRQVPTLIKVAECSVGRVVTQRGGTCTWR